MYSDMLYSFIERTS